MTSTGTEVCRLAGQYRPLLGFRTGRRLLTQASCTGQLTREWQSLAADPTSLHGLRAGAIE
jgi:hypothetical protein